MNFDQQTGHAEIDQDRGQVELPDEDVSHIRGVTTAVDGVALERSPDVQPRLAKVIPIASRRVQTFGKVSAILFSESDIAQFATKGATQREAMHLWEKLGLGKMRSETNVSMSAQLSWYRGFVASLIRKLHIANDDSSENDYPHIDECAARLCSQHMPATPGFHEVFRDLAKLYYLFLACEKVAKSNGF